MSETKRVSTDEVPCPECKGFHECDECGTTGRVRVMVPRAELEAQLDALRARVAELEARLAAARGATEDIPRHLGASRWGQQLRAALVEVPR